jgi:hypothetical protein
MISNITTKIRKSAKAWIKLLSKTAASMLGVSNICAIHAQNPGLAVLM